MRTTKNTFIATLVLVSMACNSSDTAGTATAKAGSGETVGQTAPPKTAVKKSMLTCTWVRTDAPYNIKIDGLADGGSMVATYFNPKPIHVGKASWAEANGTISVYVELRDENYPGSNYTLYYNMPEKDLLVGKYFQAIEGVTYDVGFQRAK